MRQSLLTAGLGLGLQRDVRCLPLHQNTHYQKQPLTDKQPLNLPACITLHTWHETLTTQTGAKPVRRGVNGCNESTRCSTFRLLPHGTNNVYTKTAGALPLTWFELSVTPAGGLRLWQASSGSGNGVKKGGEPDMQAAHCSNYFMGGFKFEV